MAVAYDFAGSTRSGRGVNIALWSLQVLLAAAFLMAGASKLAGAEMMVGQFETIGLGQWFRYLTGGLEIAAAILLLIPRQAGYGALLLIPIMLGAAAAHLVVFKNSPAAPLVLLALAAVVAWGRLAKPRVAANGVE
jgi:putative oxidoreductase